MLSLPLRFHTDLMDIMMQFTYQKRSPSQRKIWSMKRNRHSLHAPHCIAVSLGHFPHHFSFTNVLYPLLAFHSRFLPCF